MTLFADKKILVVDDYAINLDLFIMYGQETGADVFGAVNGRECLEQLRKHHIDMILMDLHMPEMNGIEATRAIRLKYAASEIVIVGVTGAEDQDEINACLMAGMNTVITKQALNPEKIVEIGSLYWGNTPHHNTQRKTCTPHHDQPEIADKSNGIMNYAKALREFQDDGELLHSLLQTFARKLIDQRMIIKKAFDSNDQKTIHREAHTIKGGAINICAQPLTLAARELESACKEDISRDHIATSIGMLNEQIDTFVRYIKEHHQPA